MLCKPKRDKFQRFFELQIIFWVISRNDLYFLLKMEIFSFLLNYFLWHNQVLKYQEKILFLHVIFESKTFVNGWKTSQSADDASDWICILSQCKMENFLKAHTAFVTVWACDPAYLSEGITNCQEHTLIFTPNCIDIIPQLASQCLLVCRGAWIHYTRPDLPFHPLKSD